MKMKALRAIKYGGAVRLPTDEEPFKAASNTDAKMLEENGYAARVKSDTAAKPAKPSAEQVQSALVEKILPSLTDEEWGADRKPNCDLLKGKLADHFDQSVGLSAADRDSAVDAFIVASAGQS